MPEDDSTPAEPRDNLAALQDTCINALANNADLMGKIRGNGAAWGTVKALFLGVLPQNVDDRGGLAYHMVATALTRILGEQNKAWHAFKNPERNNITYVKTGPNPNPK